MKEEVLEESLRGWQVMFAATGQRAFMCGETLYLSFKGRVIGFETLEHLKLFLKYEGASGCGKSCK